MRDNHRDQSAAPVDITKQFVLGDSSEAARPEAKTIAAKQGFSWWYRL
jgi:hypothetical protein